MSKKAKTTAKKPSSDFLERHQDPSNRKRTKVIDLFVQKAGERLEEASALAEELREHQSCSFERALADSLDALKLNR